PEEEFARPVKDDAAGDRAAFRAREPNLDVGTAVLRERGDEFFGNGRPLQTPAPRGCFEQLVIRVDRFGAVRGRALNAAALGLAGHAAEDSLDARQRGVDARGEIDDAGLVFGSVGGRCRTERPWHDPRDVAKARQTRYGRFALRGVGGRAVLTQETRVTAER